MARLPTLYIPHGGGPCFFMEDPHGIWTGMAAYLRGIAATLDARPDAHLVISAHWEEAQPTLTSAEAPPLLFDYYGFPEHTYRLSYPAPGAPDLARHIGTLLGQAGFTPAFDGARGFDHGVFVPFLLIQPDAAIPVLQLSLVAGLDPAVHLALGRALAPLRDEGVLITGSGMSYHNMQAFRTAARSDQPAQFDDWLTETVTQTGGAEREERLARWTEAPGARYSHPREEHLIPLMVAAGAAGTDPGRLSYHERPFGNPISGYQFR